MTKRPDHDQPKASLPVRRQEIDERRQVAARMRSRSQSIPGQNESISPTFIWRAFSQWWKWVVPLGLILASVAGCLVWYFHVPQYEAGALIMIQSDTPYIAFENGVENRDADRYVQTQIELLRSPVVLMPVMGRPEIASMQELQAKVDPLKHLQSRLAINQVGRSELFVVRYTSPSAEDAASVANSVVMEYLRLQSQYDRDRTELVIDKLEKERLLRSTRVEQLRKRVVDLAKEITGRDPFGQGAVTDLNRALSPASAIYQSLNEVDVNIEVLQAELQALQDAPVVFPDQNQASALLDLEIANRTDVRELVSSIAAIASEIAYVKSAPRRKIGETWQDDPNYQRLAKRSEEMKTKLDELKSVLRTELYRVRKEEQKSKTQQLIADKTHELNTLTKKRSLLADKFNEHLAQLKSGGAQSAQLEFAKAELEREERVFELIAARKLALQTELEAPTRVSLKQSAQVPAVALQPVPFKMLLIACLASLVAPFGLALAREITVKRICDVDQLANDSMLPIVGEIARFPVQPVANRQKAIPNRQQREMYIFAESIDSLRTNLMLTEDLGGEGRQCVIAIASAGSGESKTSVSTSLAASIAGATNKPTLLIDADLRSPDVARVLGVASKPGLAEVFAGKATLTEAIHPSSQSNTYILPAGEHRVNPHHILNGSKVDHLFNSLRSKFSTILVDTPPILGASEALVYTKAADLVLFCSLSGVSRAKQVKVAVERLHSTGANVAGAVLSGVPIGSYKYHQGYYGKPYDKADLG